MNRDNYGGYDTRNIFLGRGFSTFTTWNPPYPSSIAQLQLGAKSVAVMNEVFSYSLQNIGRNMYIYHPNETTFYLPHTQKKPLKRSNFRYLNEIASNAYYGNKATLAAISELFKV